MAQKPSERSRSAMEPVDLDIVPYMDIIFSLVSYILFTSTGLAEIGVINVNAPRYQDPLLAAGIEQQEPQEEKKQLTLPWASPIKGFSSPVWAACWVGQSKAASKRAVKPRLPSRSRLTMPLAGMLWREISRRR